MRVSQVKAGVILNYVILGLNALVGLAYTPFMLSKMGQSEYGLYSLAASVISYLAILDFGFGNAVIRYTAKFRAEQKIDEQYSMFGMFTILYSLIGVLTIIAGGLIYFNLDSLFGITLTVEELSKARIIFLLMVFNLAVTFPLSIYGAIITAYENFVFLRVVQIARILLNTLVMICLLTIGYKSIAMVIVQSVLNIISLLLNVFYCKYRIKVKIVFSKINWGFLKEVAVYSFWIFLNVIMDKIYWSTGQFVLGAVSGTIAVSVFSVAIHLQGMYMMFSTGISGVLLPKTTAMVATNRSDTEISDLFIKTGRLQFIILAFILSGFLVFGRDFVSLWAGEGYEDVYVITLLFFIPLTVPLIQNLGVTILQARNQMKFRSILYICVAIGSLALQIPLAKHYGGIGCAVAISFALTIGQIIIMNIYYLKKQRLDVIAFWKEIIRMSIAPAVTCVCVEIIYSRFDVHSWFQLGIWLVLFCVVYIPVFYYFALNDYEKNLMKVIITKMGDAVSRCLKPIHSHN